MAKKDLRGLELPKGTVLEIEVVDELQGEVCEIFILMGSLFYPRRMSLLSFK